MKKAVNSAYTNDGESIITNSANATPTNTPTSKCEHQEEIDAMFTAYKKHWRYGAGLLVGSSLVGNKEGDSARFWELTKECEKKCHTPTTDSKNSSEKKGVCVVDCANDETSHALDCPKAQNTTDTGWEPEIKKVLAEIEFDGAKVFECAFPFSNAKDEQYEKIRHLIQHIAKEEYERGRKDAVKFIRAKAKPLWDSDLGEIEGQLEIGENLLEAALETQP